MRADVFVSATLGISRNQASELIKSKNITLNENMIDKPSLEVKGDERVVANDNIYVSRAALKLKGFLGELKPCFLNLNALDVGSSTGGFVQILLENGVKSVTALDVGSTQLSTVLRNDKRVIVQENTDIRKFNSSKFDLVTVDVSFISILQILNDIDRLAKRDIILLFKPQFEVGANAKRSKKGVVKDKKLINLSKAKFEIAASELGWSLKKSKESVITGKEGNLELFYYYVKR
ncbi:23S rRNA (cytidine-2'-O)-methyltransferase TlyA [Campylobacter fetus]